MSAQQTLVAARSTPPVPLELVAAIMLHLAPEDLRNMAGSCRQYKSTAYLHAGLSIPVQVSVALPPNQDAVRQLAACRDTVRHAVQHELRLELDIHYYLPLLDLEGHKDLGKTLVWIGDLCASISEAFPVLVNLHLTVPDAFGHTLQAALSHPAPHLRGFLLQVMPENGLPWAGLVSEDIFARSAPKLGRVQFRNVSLGDNAIPAFAAVRSAELEYSPYAPPMRISTVLPVIRYLDLVCVGDRELQAASVRLRFDLDGLALERLTVFDDMDYPILNHIDPPTAVYDIPVVVHNNPFPDLCPAFWCTVPGNLSMRIVDEMRGGSIDTLVTIATETRDYVRVYKRPDTEEVEPDSEDEDEGEGVEPIVDPEFLSGRLAYIRLDKKYLRIIFGLADGLPVLRRLQIDVRDTDDLTPDQEDPAVLVSCPALEDLVIFALEGQLQMHCDEMASLAVALGLEDDDRATGPVLTLVGVDFGGETSSSLEPVFSRIVYRPFSGRGSPDDLENGFWEY